MYISKEFLIFSAVFSRRDGTSRAVSAARRPCAGIAARAALLLRAASRRRRAQRARAGGGCSGPAAVVADAAERDRPTEDSGVSCPGHLP